MAIATTGFLSSFSRNFSAIPLQDFASGNDSVHFSVGVGLGFPF